MSRSTTVNGCKINALLQGTFHKQPTGNEITTLDFQQQSTVTYEQVVITATSVSSWGECYENVDNSYIFGLKRTGDSYCFRCVTMIIRASNIIQAAHASTNSCRSSIAEARSTCFDENSISPFEGTFLYRKYRETV
uniref:DUF7044 domain-containing protein n=1 Tax=Syphacia muris TaxID=451379 RepID=A0A0N5AQS3_9BILA